MSLLQLRSNSGIGTILHALNCNNLKKFIYLNKFAYVLETGEEAVELEAEVGVDQGMIY
jgi:hypothetical protein